MKKHLKSFDNFRVNENRLLDALPTGLTDWLTGGTYKKKEKFPSSFRSTSSDASIKDSTVSLIDFTYETSWDAALIINIKGDVRIGTDGYILNPRKITVNPSTNWDSLEIPGMGRLRYQGTEGYTKDPDALSENVSSMLQKSIGKDLKLSFYKLDLSDWAEEHNDEKILVGAKDPSWVRDGVKLPFIEKGEIPKTNLVDDRSGLKEAIWVDIGMTYAPGRTEFNNPGNGLLREISVSSTRIW